MADVFGRSELSFGGAFAADSAAVTFSSGDCGSSTAGNALGAGGLAAGVGMLAQQLQFSYMQPIQRFFELGTQKVYYFAGRPSGQGSIARMVGPRAINVEFYQRLGNVCCTAKNIIQISARVGCDFDGFGDIPVAGLDNIIARTVFYTLKGVILNSVGAAVAAEDMIFREALSFVFFTMAVA